MRHAPWRDALTVLALPLAATLLLVWTFGFISRYDHWPLDEGWVLLLGGSLVAVVGAALQRGRLAAAGAFAVFATAASPYLGLGTGTDFTGTPSFYHGWGVDIGVASLLPTLLLVVAGLSNAARGDRAPRRPLPAGGGIRAGRDRGGVPVPGTVARADHHLDLHVTGRARLSSASARPIRCPGFRSRSRCCGSWGSPSPWRSSWRGERRAVARAWALASGLVLASVAYPLVWVLLRTDPVPTPWWLYNGAYPLLLGRRPAAARPVDHAQSRTLQRCSALTLPSASRASIREPFGSSAARGPRASDFTTT